MTTPVVLDPFAATADTFVIPTLWPVPDVGLLPMNAFLVKAEEPVLVDTGAGVVSDEFIDALSSLIDVASLRWIWLTHEDRDHTGSLNRLLELAPRATVVADFFAVGRIMPEQPFPLDRLRVISAGDRLHVGDRELVAYRPPLYDSPATTGLVDATTGVLFSSDCFGAPLPSLAEASVHSVAELDPQTVRRSQVTWATVDSPWVTSVRADAFARSLETVRRLDPTAILSSHLPPAFGQTEALLANLAAVIDVQTPDTESPDAESIAEVLASFAPEAPDGRAAKGTSPSAP